ncbi:MAG: hypothetical protein E6Q83_01830 [Thiothrix sp.]|nr:MAG: hypothetical protein E6Q83_01830 [Thiothrix sp.]
MLNNTTDWLTQHDTLLYWIGIISLLMFVFSLLLLPILINKIPADYFSLNEHERAIDLLKPRNILRNVVGLIVLLAGLAMLFLPGQGLICVLIGLTIMKFPGKYALERWIITRKGVLASLNWIREKGGKQPLKV